MRGLVGALAIAGLLAGCGGSHFALRLRRAPYLGLAACGRTAAHRCNRIGVAVWLQQPASAVTAVVDDVPVALRTHAGGSGSYRKHLFWQGIFQDPHVQRLTEASAPIPIRLRVSATNGSVSVRTRAVLIHRGYG